MQSILRQYDIRFVCHFTDASNLALINHYGGLFSLAECNQRNIVIPEPGGNNISHDLDKRLELDSYIHLTWRNNHPMIYVAQEEGRIKNPVWLTINSSIILGENVRFSTDVANKTGVDILTAEDATKAIDFEVLFTRMDWNDPKIRKRRQAAEKSEILVRDFIPITDIINFAELTENKNG